MGKKGTMRAKRDRRNAVAWLAAEDKKWRRDALAWDRLAEESGKREAAIERTMDLLGQALEREVPKETAEQGVSAGQATDFLLRRLERLVGLPSPPAGTAGDPSPPADTAGGIFGRAIPKWIRPQVWGVCSCHCPPELRGPSGFAVARATQLTAYPRWWVMEFCRGWNKFPRRRGQWLWDNAIAQSPGVKHWANHCPDIGAEAGSGGLAAPRQGVGAWPHRRQGGGERAFVQAESRPLVARPAG